MPYSTNRDRNTFPLEITKAPWPLSPLNLFLRSGFKPGIFDLTWDQPSNLSVNSTFSIVGVNIYRSFDSEFGPFERITDLPVGATFWRDVTDNVLIPDEDVSRNWTIFGTSGNSPGSPRYVFKTLYPIVKAGSQNVPANGPDDVQVFVDGQLARVKSVQGRSNEVELDTRDVAEVGTQTLTRAIIPTTTSKVTCSYRYSRSLLRTDLMQRVFYRVTTVGVPVTSDIGTVQPQDWIETPLEHAVATSVMEVEKRDYIWNEAVRRNRWILDQGGERVKLFLRKNVGLPCPCSNQDHHKQPLNDCGICYGTSIRQGFEGPYEAIIAPDDAERRISQKEQGRTVEHTYEVWTGPTPILSQRDFLVKINGERYSIGPVRFPTNRGMLLQQHFNIGHIDEQDIRSKVPLDGPRYPAVQFGPSGPEQEASMDITSKPNIPDERELRGRTKAWEGQNY